LSGTQSAGYLAREITRQGFILSANEVFWLSGISVLALIPVVWLAKKKVR
jgi:DHA2 family multidrug resistance protein